MPFEAGTTSRISRRAALRAGAGVGAGVLLATGASSAASEHAHAGEPTLRWDIVHLTMPGGVLTVSAGGEASARTISGEAITVTGTGTFIPGVATSATGGGTFRIVNADGGPIASGSYQVTELLYWQEAPGTLPDAVTDTIGANSAARSGLAVFKVLLAGDDGVLVVSCHLPAGTPDQIFEGIIAAHRFASFYKNEAPQDGVDANRTAFHVLS